MNAHQKNNRLFSIVVTIFSKFSFSGYLKHKMNYRVLICLIILLFSTLIIDDVIVIEVCFKFIPRDERDLSVGFAYLLSARFFLFFFS